LEFWGCREEHFSMDFPHRKKENKSAYNIQESTTINDVARSMPQIYASLDNRQVDHQASVMEMEGMISNHIVYILINPHSNLSLFPSNYGEM
jgi:hypothetical protein